MCLTIPKKVVEIKNNCVVIENPNGSRQELKSIVKLKIGDFCLSQQGIVIERISKKEAEEVLNILRRKE